MISFFSSLPCKDGKKPNNLSLHVYMNECLSLPNFSFNSWLKFQAVITVGKRRICKLTFCI